LEEQFFVVKNKNLTLTTDFLKNQQRTTAFLFYNPLDGYGILGYNKQAVRERSAVVRRAVVERAVVSC
jgi:hypothetical protein